MNQHIWTCHLALEALAVDLTPPPCVKIKPFEQRWLLWCTYCTLLTHTHAAYYNPYLCTRPHTHTHTQARKPSHIPKVWILHINNTHIHARAASGIYADFSVWAKTTCCGHVSGCWLIMGNYHGNQCHVMSSGSPGSLPFLSGFMFSEKRRVRGDDEGKRWEKR